MSDVRIRAIAMFAISAASSVENHLAAIWQVGKGLPAPWS